MDSAKAKRALVSLCDRSLPNRLQGCPSRVEVVAPDARDSQLEARLSPERELARIFLECDGRLERAGRFRPTENRFDHPLGSKCDRERRPAPVFLCNARRRAGVAKRVRQLLAQEEERGREPFCGVGLHGSTGLWVCQALPEKLDGEPLVPRIVMYPSKSTQRLSPKRADVCTFRRFCEQRASTSRGAGLEVSRACVEPSTVGGLSLRLRREAQGELAQLGGCLGCATRPGDQRRFIERCSDVRICTDGARSKMTCALLGIVNDSGQPPTNLPLVLWSRASIHSRGIEWMGEANALPEQFHQSGVDRRAQTSRNLLLAKNGPEESERRLRSRCRYE